MFQVTITAPEAPPRIESITDTSAIIGKGRECQLRLPGWKVGREHARIFRTKAGLHIQDLGQLFGTSVNGNRIQQYGPIMRGDRIGVGPYTLVIEDQLETASAPPTAKAIDTRDSPAVEAPGPRSTNDRKAPTPEQFWRQRIHEALLDAIDLRRRDLVRMADEELRAETEALLVELIDKESALPDSIDRESLLRDVLDEAVGLGPLET
ncbi:FHA domain-containing protein, partial [Thauera sp.]